MRAFALLLALLVALTPLSVAEDGDPPESSEGSSTSASHSNSTSSSPRPPPDTPECKSDGDSEAQASQECQEKFERYCHDNSRDPRCRPDEQADGNHSDDQNETDSEGNATGADRGARFCAAPGLSIPQSAACRRFLQEFRDGFEDDHFVTFQVDETNLTLQTLRVGGRLVLQSLQLDAGSDNVTVERVGRQLQLGDSNTQLSVHDDPTGLIRFKGDDGHLTLTFPAGVTAEAHPQGFRMHYPSGQIGLLLAEDAVWLDNSTVVIATFGAFHIPASNGDSERPRDAAEAHERVKDAIERRQIGAEVSLKLPEATNTELALATGEASGNESIQVLAYDDVEIRVDEQNLADPDQPIRVEVSSDLDEGRTIVINLDDSLLASGRPEDLLLRYFDLHNQTDGTVLETEVLFAQSSSLVDVLDATNDGGQPEYWIVEDADGIQVLFSVPHWSTHAITITNLGIDMAPNVAYGIIAGAVAAVAAGVMLFMPRRRDEDDF